MTNDLHTSDAAPALDDRPAPTSVGRSSTHGKAILFGEHTVLYGAPALALPVTDLVVEAVATPIPTSDPVTDGHRLQSSVHTGPLDTAPSAVLPTVTAVRATLRHLGIPDIADADAADVAAHADADIAAHADAAGAASADGAGIPDAPRFHVRVDSAVPTARGLGSSAAVAGAVAGAVADALGATLTADERFALVQECERIAHGSASGLDARAVVADGPVWFDHGTVTALPVHGRFTFVVADTGVPGHTREAVAAVRALADRRPDLVAEVVGRITRLAETAARLLGDVDEVHLTRAEHLGAAMDDAQTLLTTLGVSSPDVDRLVGAARAAGALGAKLTGGGRGGCVLVLVADDAAVAPVGAALRAAGATDTWTTRIGASA
ncbi:mevalonate kinase [Curtobacterium sp. RRHDQ10]|uniref:mevalonate kinase n=1 Tax=Curtobacterium phyllosphaerae TaxID=3413379 RepID=UPI003BF2488F